MGKEGSEEANQMKCDKCGHEHKEKDCFSAYCIKCGLGGDLTAMSCEYHQKLKPKIELYLPKQPFIEREEGVNTTHES